MSLWAIVPVKPLRRGKSRLSSVLSEDERAVLNYTMLGNTLKTLTQVPEVDQILVVSRDPSALALAREYNARTVQEDGNPGLNLALRRATVVAQVYAVQGVLILPADLPLIRPTDIQEFIRRAVKPPVMVIAPDRHEGGTNALLVSPPGFMDYSFGPGSFQRHIHLAERHDLRVEICRLSTIGLDLDLPEDLDLLRQMESVQVEF